MFTMKEIDDLVGKTVTQSVSLDHKTILFVTGADLWGFKTNNTPCHADYFSYMIDPEKLIDTPILSIRYQKAKVDKKLHERNKEANYFEIVLDTDNGESILGVANFPCSSGDGEIYNNKPELTPTGMISSSLPTINASVIL